MPSTATKKCNERRMSMVSVSTKTKYNVQHRSDLLMDEHVRNVRQVQFELQSVLQELDSAKSVEQMETLRDEAATLKARSDKLVLVLQVMDKINSELSYARTDLNDALHKGIGDINAARKRVIWLEDKMGELCGKKRLKSRRPSNRFITAPNYGFDTDSEREQTRRMRPLDSSERMYTSEHARHHSITQLLGSEIGYTSESDLLNRHVGFQDVSTSHTGNKGLISSQEDVSLNTDGIPVSGGRIADHRKPLHDSMVSLTLGHGEIAEESGSEKFSVVKEMSVTAASPVKVTSTPDLLHDGTFQRDDTDDGAYQNYDDEGLDRDEEQEDGDEEEEERAGEEEKRHVTVDMRSGFDYDDEEERGSDEESEADERGFYDEEAEEDEEKKEEVDDGVEDEEEEEEGEEEDGKERRGEREKTKTTFITEVTGMSADAQEEEDKEPTHRDFGKEYWQSEHHRFEYSDFADILTAMDPLSYHQMGLAVPGSFITKEDTKKDFDELPWRPRRKGSDIKDIHRIALDKLATRVHGMYDKVYNATMLSVKGKENLPRERSIFQSYDGMKMKPGSSSTRTSDMPQTAPASTRQKTEDGLPLASGQEKEVKRSSTFTAGRLVFYPKPIPPPHVLPITRTSLNKEFPHFASHFAKPEPEVRKPAERLVDQRNLMEETKLVLYREKIKPSTPGPTRLERKFRRMLERDGAASNKSSGPKEVQREKYTAEELRKKLQTGFKTAAVMTKLQGALAGWNQIKPKSRGNEFSGLRWERVKTIVHKNLTSQRAEERIDAARQLGVLRCCDTMVFYALKDSLQNDPDDRVRYEAAKSLILIGCWEDLIIQSVLKYLVMGNTEIRSDMIETLIQGKNVQYVNKNIPSFLELVKVLSHFCLNPDPDDLIAFDSAVCLGRLCVKDDNAKTRLLSAMKESKQTEIRAKALEILVKQLNCINDEIVTHILILLQESPVWKFRALACRLLISLGPKQEFVIAKTEEIYSLLSRKLWDDPNMEVRLAAAKALTALGMFAKVCDSVERNLESADEDARSQAAISVGTLGMKSEKLIRLLLEMIELDSSDYVRLMIVRTFGILRLTDKRVLRCLREREKLDGPLARESRRALRVLDQMQGAVTSRSLPVSLTQVPKPFTKKRVLSPIPVAVF